MINDSCNSPLQAQFNDDYKKVIGLQWLCRAGYLKTVSQMDYLIEGKVIDSFIAKCRLM